MVYILGIETSCDETAVAIYAADSGLLAHNVYTQAIHTQHGGVVPELASRDHVRKLIPIIDQSLQDASIDKSQISAIAYTAGPGLAGALMVGAGCAVSLAKALNVPAIPVHHLEAHILIAMLENPKVTFPFLSLLVSGGHTQLIMAHALDQYEIIGDTVDDAIGEAFDKTAKIMGLPYPGGKEVAAVAEAGDPAAYTFPRPMTQHDNLQFSFSGLKTAVMQAWQQSTQAAEDRAHIAASFQQAVVDTCRVKVAKALQQTQASYLVLAGGVAANSVLRQAMKETAAANKASLVVPRFAWCTDNGAMVAYTGFLHYEQYRHNRQYQMMVKPRWPIQDRA